MPIQQEELGIPLTAEDQPDLATIGDFYQVGMAVDTKFYMLKVSC